jgi:hypothetical protein
VIRLAFPVNTFARVVIFAAVYIGVVAAMQIAIAHEHTILYSFFPAFFAGLVAFSVLLALIYTAVPQSRRAALTCVLAILLALVLGSIVGYIGETCTRGVGVGGLLLYIFVVAFQIAGITINSVFAVSILAAALAAVVIGNYVQLPTTSQTIQKMAWAAVALFIVTPYVAQLVLQMAGIPPSAQSCFP